jgi:hypothetical protein
MKMQTLDLSQRAMLADLSISCWEAVKTDKKASREYCASHNIDARAARVRKELLPEDAKEYDAVCKAARHLRDVFKDQTLPWGEGTRGVRVLPAANYVALGDALRKPRADFEEKVAAFLAAYPQLREEARKRLNGTFNEDDYPTPAYMANRFRVSFSVMPFPASNDFRVNLGDAEVDAIKAQIEAETTTIAQGAMREAWGRLRETLERMVERLAAKDEDGEPATYRDTLFSNLSEIADLLPRLNLTGDPVMDKLAADTKQAITDRLSPEQCRRNPRARQTAIDEATRILSLLPPRKN